MMGNNTVGNNWAFQDNTFLNPAYEGNFDADIAAVAESVGDDSGYYSNDVDCSEAGNDDFTTHGNPPPSPITEAKPSPPFHIFYDDVPASNKSNHGSLYTGALNKSTTHLEKRSFSSKQRKERRMSKTLHHPTYEYEPKTPHKYSMIKCDSGSCPLELWWGNPERHEMIAYRLERATPRPSRDATRV